MKKRIGGGMTLACDDCEDELTETFDTDDFRAMVDHAKSKGWLVRPDGEGGWSHRCGTCKPGSLDAQKRLLGL